jgi:hypothetical protein
MNDASFGETKPVNSEVVNSEVVSGQQTAGASPVSESIGHGSDREFVSEPAKVMRVGSMIKQLLDEVRMTELDEPSRQRLRAIYDTSITELGSALSPDLRDELGRLAFPFQEDGVPTEIELRVAQAQLVGWLEGLFHGIQATLFAQQMAARQQFEGMRGELPSGSGGLTGAVDPDERPGTYL